MLHKTLLIYLLLFFHSYEHVLCQEKSEFDFSFVDQENIEYTALKPLFYLVRQEYIIISENGEKLTRGGNDYFGKAYAIGVITENLNICFPKSIRYPWKEDISFNEYKDGFKPECTYTKFKALDDALYRSFLINDLDTNNVITCFPLGSKGIKISETLPSHGSLVIFHTIEQSPENNEDIQYSIVNIDDAVWNTDSICEFETPYMGNQQIIGGAFFKRIIFLGRIEWELAGMYIPINGTWVIKSILNQYNHIK